MSFIAVATIGGSLIGAKLQSNAVNTASDLQSGFAQQGIDVQRQQFTKVLNLLKPYRQAGRGALREQERLLGLRGDRPQKRAIRNIARGPQFAALVQQGENAILQNASATGGLRGGNTQGALAQFRPQVLSALINQQFSNLGGIAGLGQASAAGTAAAAQNTGNSVAGLLQDQGAAQAGGALAQGQIGGNLASDITGAVTRGLAGGFGNFSGSFADPRGFDLFGGSGVSGPGVF